MPLLFVCEDNGIGISVKTPQGWIARTYGDRADLRYFTADGANLPEVLTVATQAAEYVRTQRRPAFLHLRTVRLMGHGRIGLRARLPQHRRDRGRLRA